MPVYGRTSTVQVGENNIIRNLPSLPIPMELGSISYTVGFQQQPSGSFTYDGILESQLPRFESVYLQGINRNAPPEVTLFGIPFVCDSYAYDRTHYIYGGEQHFDRFKVTVSLRGKYEKRLGYGVRVSSIVPKGSTKVTIEQLAAKAAVPYKGPSFSITVDPKATDAELTLSSAIEAKAAVLGCYISYTKGVELKPLDNGATWNFSSYEVINDGSNTVKGAQAYNEAIATLSEDAADEDAEDTTGRKKPTKKEPKTEVIVEEDENVGSPPEGSIVLKTVDSNSIDGSGKKKTRKTTTQVDGTTVKERVEIYGWRYTARDIYRGDGVLLGDPAEFWGLIELQETTYTYETPPGLTLLVKAQYDPSNSFSVVGLVVHPDYEQLVQGGAFGTSLSFTPKAKYLTKVETTGWRYCRLEKETDALETIDLVDEPTRLRLYEFKKIPKVGKTQYLLQSNRKANNSSEENQSIPFSVEWKKYDELPSYIKNKVNLSQITPDATVGILTPDLNYVEPLSILKEIEERSSFAWAPDPDSDPEDPKPPKITGEETSHIIDRLVTATNRYREKEVNFSTQNAGFSDIAESIVYKDVIGKPPDATTMQANWEDPNTTGDGDSSATSNSNKSKRYLVTTDLVGDTPKGGSVSLPEGVKTIADMKKAIATALRIEGLQGSQERKKLAWFYPNIMDGDVCYTGADRFRSLGKPRVMSISHTIDVNGRNNKYELLWATCGGCELSLGLDRPRTVDIREERTGASTDPNNPSSTSGDPKLVVTSPTSEFNLGSAVISGPNRRNF